MNTKIAPIVAALIAALSALACSTAAPQNTPTAPPSATATPVTGAQNVPTGTDAAKGGATPISTPAADATATPDATGAFFLNIEAPSGDEVVVYTRMLDVKGRSTVDALVSVNDTIAEIDGEGRFSVPVELTEGPNIVEVVASDTDGGQFSEVLLVIYDPDGSA